MEIAQAGIRRRTRSCEGRLWRVVTPTGRYRGQTGQGYLSCTYTRNARTSHEQAPRSCRAAALAAIFAWTGAGLCVKLLCPANLEANVNIQCAATPCSMNHTSASPACVCDVGIPHSSQSPDAGPLWVMHLMSSTLRLPLVVAAAARTSSELQRGSQVVSRAPPQTLFVANALLCAVLLRSFRAFTPC